MTTLFAMVGGGSLERSSDFYARVSPVQCDVRIYPRVRIKLVRVNGAYRVQSCLVWLDNSQAQFLQSGENYESTAAAYVEMKRRTMNLLWESGRAETEREVNWVMESE